MQTYRDGHPEGEHMDSRRIAGLLLLLTAFTAPAQPQEVEVEKDPNVRQDLWACPGYVDSRVMLPTLAVRPQAQNPLD